VRVTSRQTTGGRCPPFVFSTGRRLQQQRKNEMTGQYSWWAIGIVLMLAYFFISVMGIAHEGAKVILR